MKSKIKNFFTVAYFILVLIVLLFVLIYSSLNDDIGNSIETNKPEPTPSITVEPTVKPTIKPVETAPVEPEPSEPPQLVAYYAEKDVIALAKVLYNECRGIPSTVEKACVGWTACNRVDAGYGDTIYEVLTAPNQFAYNKRSPVTEELYYLALDVLERWNSEKNGFEDVGRVLPSNYLWFYGDGVHNYFRDKFDGDYNIWDYSLDNPYDN